MSRLTLSSPLSGWSAPLDEAPDAVFAQKMLGDGVLIDPTGNQLVAPCDGEVVSIAASHHAIAVRATNGAEILLHVGIDTVALAGKGFELHVAPGAKVCKGDRLLTFDLALLAREATSLVTPVIVTNGDRFEIVRAHTDCELMAGDALLEIQPLAGADAKQATAEAERVSEKIRVDHEHGIHARPAALIANYAKALPFDLEVIANGRSANPRSAVALMSLGIRGGDEIIVAASGAEGAAAIAEVRRLIHGLEGPGPAKAKHAEIRPIAAASAPTDPSRIKGVIASRGLAIGTAFYLREAEIAVVEAGAGVAHESAELERARGEVRQRLQALAKEAAATAREIITAHLEFVDDWELVAAARRSIAHGKSAAFSWRRAVRDSADALKALGDPRIAERVDDLLDLERQVLVALLGQTPTTQIEIPDRAVILAEDLKPSQFVSLDARKLAGICLAAGGPTSHVSILAAAVGVPTLVAAGPAVLGIEDGTALILDTEQGVLRVAPDQGELASAERTIAARRQRQSAERSAAQNLCRTADGKRIEVFANLGSLGEATHAVAQGAEGCGLLRTEFLFLEREQAPDEREQLRRYQEIADALAGRPLIIRTLDIGGDKPIPYLPLPAEENPALGLRGIRTSLWQPDLLRVQLRALLQVQPAGQCRVLLPMITDVAEVRIVRKLIDEIRRELGITTTLQVGAMIETPASAAIADQIAREVDFFSIGTNDLTQYTLAMDRGHADLAARIDALHPAVLRLIAMTAEAGARHNRLVAMCGGLASDPAAVPVLLGLGLTELSVVPSMIPQLKHLIGHLTLDACRPLAQRALAQESAEAVRSLLAETSNELKVAL
ncbi:phosphocarrier protein FPr/phosphocarrier protein [Povalibacter uvarum]|uniref:phosphoenolpyruvate--protein phosphotransferase n=1 Tax=Povalibacter uvarum TaxID=732238 RepID=A0A841HVJ4_9GAMM|nr:phosphoenolpyruvate--protein phosphotransferase [Povalibacter uvarum]MBB6095948.1 phosphocarrier protein FPr/phosphocarrier protein [Povalibacter uvarum]